MNLEEWREQQAQGVEAELPSGLTVRLRRVTIPDIIQNGGVPKHLSAIVEDGLFGRPIMTGEEEGATLEDFQKYREFVAFLAGEAIVDPEDLDVAELPWPDQYAIFLWLTEGGERKLKTFPGKKS